MTALSFSKLIPGGNPTILLHDPDLDGPELALASARLMSPLHLQAEQVGALHPGRADGTTLPRLRMMGGEFCVNATRCAALLLARQGALRLVRPATGQGRAPEGAPGTVAPGTVAPGTGVADVCTGGSANGDAAGAPGRAGPGSGSEADAPVWGGEVEVSGAAAPVRVLVSPCRAALERVLLHGSVPEDTDHALLTADAALKGSALTVDAALQEPVPASLPGSAVFSAFAHARGGTVLFCAARILGLETAALCDCAGPGLSRVVVPGIVHLLADTVRHALPDVEGAAWQVASAALRVQAGLEREPASGVVWVEERGGEFAIWPAVRVLATESEHLESACGSASLAVALRLWGLSGALRGMVSVRQPSGELLCVHPDPSQPDTAWVSGRVELVAEGIAHI